MSVTLRGRKVRYDNISVGNATGPERTIAGETVSPVEIHGGGQRTSTSTGEAWHTNIKVGVSVSNQAALPENVVESGGNGAGELLG